MSERTEVSFDAALMDDIIQPVALLMTLTLIAD